MIKHITFKRSAWVRLVAIALWAMTLVTANAYDYIDSSGIAYNINSDGSTASVTYKTTSYNNYSGSVTIPATITTGGKSYSVTEVGDNAFRNCSSLQQVTLGDKVMAIGSRAFLGCSNLKSIIIVPSVTRIRDYAFADCSQLRQVTINTFAPLKLGTGAFLRCTSLTTVEWLSCNRLEGLGGMTELGTMAFSGCVALEHMLLPGNLQQLGNSIFDGCTSMRSLTVMSDIPIAVKGDPFSLSTSQVTLYVPRGIEPGEIKARYLASPGWRDYNIDELDYSFIDQDNYTYIKLSDNTVSLTGCQTPVTSVNVRRSIKDCSGTTLDVVAISDAAFKTSQVKTLNASEAYSLQSIGREAFAGCAQLDNVMLSEGPVTMGEKVFKDCVALQSINLPSTLRVVPQQALAGCTALNHVKLLNGVQEIDSLAFAGCNSLVSIKLPRSLVEVKPRAFAGCTQLQSFRIDTLSSHFACPDGVLVELASDFDYPVEERGKMKRVVAYPMGKKSTHYYCPWGIVELAPYAFENVQSLTYLALPATMERLAGKCLVGTNLQRINSRSVAPTVVGDNTFSDISTSTIVLQVPEGAVESYRNATGWKNFKNIQERNNALSNEAMAYDWDNEGNAMVVNIMPAAVNAGTLNLPSDISMSGVNYAVAGLKNTSTQLVAGLVTTLNLSSDNLAYIDTSEGINPLAALTALQNLSLSEANQAFVLDDQGLLTSASGTQIFYYLRSKTNTTLTLDSKVRTIMPQAFAHNTHLERLVFTPRLREIGIGAFENCTKLSIIDNATGVTAIKAKAFKGCPLTTFNGGDVLVEAGEKAFDGCASLKYFPLAHGAIESIGNKAFRDCSSLKGAVISNNITTIGDDAFLGCTGLEKVVILGNVDPFGQDVFRACPSLQQLWLNNSTPPVVDHTTFEYNNQAAHTLWVPEEAVSAYRSHPVWGKFGTIHGTYQISHGCDVNADGVVNAIDITFIYNILLGFSSDDASLNRHCDVNRDGAITASDITLIYNYILNGIEPELTFKFVNQEDRNVNQLISMGDAHEVVKAIDHSTDQVVPQGLSAIVDNPQVLNVKKVTKDGVQCIELVPVAPGYAVVVFSINNNGTYYYREYPVKVTQ